MCDAEAKLNLILAVLRPKWTSELAKLSPGRQPILSSKMPELGAEYCNIAMGMMHAAAKGVKRLRWPIEGGR